MRFIEKISLGAIIVKAKILRQSIPVVAGWALTYRCNKQCAYCHWRLVEVQEKSTKEIKLMIDKLKVMGLRMVIFTGGEPFLREDMSEVITYAKKKKLITYINSNGSNMQRHIEGLKDVDCLNFSLEGPQEIHDRIRGEGSFQEVIKSAELAAEHNLKFVFTMTLNKFNLNSVEYVLNLALDFGTKVTFQLLDHDCIGSTVVNPLLPLDLDLCECIKRIIAYKRSSLYRRTVGNSLQALRFFSNWPKLPFLKCAAGRVTFRITPEGTLIPCADNRSLKDEYKLDILSSDARREKDFFRSMRHMNTQCFCGCANRVEVAMLWDLKFTAILNKMWFIPWL